jgi:hypothetical protein
MKSAIIAVVSILALVSAAPQADTQWYNIKTRSYVTFCLNDFSIKVTILSEIETLSNLYLSSNGGKIGAFAGARESADVAGKFFTTDYLPTATISIHPGDVQRQFVLSGKSGLLNLIDMSSPTADTIPLDTPSEWSVFFIGQGGVISVKDGRPVEGKWVVYLETDGDYYVGYWDGVTPQPRTVANTTLIAEKITAPS